MSSIVYEYIGPMEPRFSITVGRYLANSVTLSQIECLRKFSTELRQKPVRVTCVRIEARDVLYVGVCNHVIEFRNHGTIVRDISPGVFPH
jgi:hypothetical protein